MDVPTTLGVEALQVATRSVVVDLSENQGSFSVSDAAGEQRVYRVENGVNEDSGSGALGVVTEGSGGQIAWQSIEQVIAWPVVDE